MYRYIEGHGVISNSYTVKCYLLKIKFTITTITSQFKQLKIKEFEIQPHFTGSRSLAPPSTPNTCGGETREDDDFDFHYRYHQPIRYV